MTHQALLREIDLWSLEDRLQLLDEIWTGLLSQGYEPSLTDAQRDEIDHRVAEDNAEPDDIVSWDEVKSEALKRARK